MMSLYIIFGAKRQKMSNANGDNINVAGETLPVIVITNTVISGTLHQLDR